MKCMRCNVEMMETGVLSENKEMTVVTIGSMNAVLKSPDLRITECVDVFTDFGGGGL